MSGLDGLGFAANVFGVVDLSSKLLASFAFYLRDVKNAQDDRARLMQEVTQFYILSTRIKELLDSPQGAQLKSSRALALVLADSKSLLQELDDKLAPAAGASSSRGVTLATAVLWPFQRNGVNSKIALLENFRTKAESALQIDTAAVVLSLNTKVVVDRLLIANDALFNSQTEEHKPTCLAGTSVEILAKISEWVNDPAAKPIFWLCGKAGTGKSTVSRTVANSLSTQKQLCGNFFFKRNEGSRSNLSRFFSTLAAGMIAQTPVLAQPVKEALDSDPQICTKTTTEQFEKLLYEPLAAASSSRAGPTTVVVIDALDECEGEDSIVLLLRLLARVHSIPNGPKIFVTSRPDLYPRIAFRRIKGVYQGVVMEKMARAKEDIAIYIQHELANVRNNYNLDVPSHRQLPDTWPEENDVTLLSTAATPLFIFAATICRLVSDRTGGPPDEQLQYVLAFQKQNSGQSQPHHIEQLASTYMPVLNKLVAGQPPGQQKETLRGFKSLVGAIISVAIPLSASTLAELLEIRRSAVDTKLDLLYSVLSVPSDPTSPVRLLHLSFRDFLTRCKEDNPFWIDECVVHQEIFDRCLSIMGSLKQDICDVGDTTTHCLDISSDRIDKSLTPALQYVCLYWVHHLYKLDDVAVNLEKIQEFLNEHLLHWIEALSFMDMCTEALDIVRSLRLLITKTQSHHQLISFLRDTERCILANFPILKDCPLQVYSSFLVFAPMSSILRKQFGQSMDAIFQFPPRTQENWTELVQTIERTTLDSKFINFSPDLTYAALADGSVVTIWFLESGIKLLTLEAHGNPIYSVDFSPNSELVVTIDIDGVPNIWSLVLSNRVLLPLDQAKRICSVAFSPNSQIIAAASVDGAIDIWDITSGGELRTFASDFEGAYFRRVEECTLHFSPNSIFLVSSTNRVINIWHIASGQCTCLLKRWDYYVPRVAFSPDSCFVAAASRGGGRNEIRVWDLSDFQCTQLIELSHDVETLSISGKGELIAVTMDGSVCKSEIPSEEMARMVTEDEPTGQYLCISPDYRYIVKWEDGLCISCTLSGRRIYTLKQPNHSIWRADFSQDSKLLASVSVQGRISLWDVSSILESDTPHSECITAIDYIRLCPDFKIAVAVSFEGPINFWDCESGDQIRTIDKRWKSAHEIFFSPKSKLLAVLDRGVIGDTLAIYDVQTGSYLCSIPQPEEDTHIRIRTFVFVSFSQDSNYIAAMTRDGIAQVWDTRSGERIEKWTLDLAKIEPKGRETWTLDLPKSEPECRPQFTVTNEVTQGAFAPFSTTPTTLAMVVQKTVDGAYGRMYEMGFTYIFSGIISIWDLQSLDKHTSTDGCYFSIHWVEFTPGARFLVAAGVDALVDSIGIWQAATGELIYHDVVPDLLLSSPSTTGFLEMLMTTGYINLERVPASSSQLHAWIHSRRGWAQGFSISADGCWITYDGKPFLWMPAAARPYAFHVTGSTIIMASQSCTTNVLRFKTPPRAAAADDAPDRKAALTEYILPL